MQRFVLKPRFNNLSEYELKYTDILTYTTIRSFYNSQDKYCYPSYDAISKRSGLSKKFISESIKRLECASLLDVWRIIKVRTQHCYKFPTEGTFDKVPFAIFDQSEFTAQELSMMLLLHEYCDSTFELNNSISELASSSGVPYRTLKTQIKSLLLKGYVVEVEREDFMNQTIEKVLKFTDKIDWCLPGSRSITIQQDSPKVSTFDVDAVVKMVRKATKMGIKQQ